MRQHTHAKIVHKMRHDEAVRLWSMRAHRRLMDDPKEIDGMMDLRDDEPNIGEGLRPSTYRTDEVRGSLFEEVT